MHRNSTRIMSTPDIGIGLENQDSPVVDSLDDLMERRLRLVCAYVVPLRGPVGFRRIPVARLLLQGRGVDIPVLGDVWTAQGMVDEYSLPISHRTFRRRGNRGGWEMYNIWFLRPFGERIPANPYLQYMSGAPPATGEFVVLRQALGEDHILELRRRDYQAMESALIRVVHMLYNEDPRWRPNA
ncbi:hypothetical protein VTO73DRAFT_11659 [Trametes versicolor]